MNRITAFLRGWSQLTQVLEATLIDNVAATIPWMAPIIPAWFAYENMTVVLGMPQAISLVGAAVIEFLGLATVSTTFKLWQYNDSKRKTDQVAPVQIAIGTTIFYLLIVLTVNVILDSSPITSRIAKALLSLLSVAGAVVLAIRAQHSRRLESIELERQERRELRQEIRRERLAESYRQDTGNFPETIDRIGDWRKLTIQEQEAVASMTTTEITQKYPITERTARLWREKSRNNNRH
ncbi:MAG TPA: hypothetical protein PKL11_06355 [Anaerolineaceae bacterium]|nr:hypothetical protein [Anaerolineaceae bacterium]